MTINQVLQIEDLSISFISNKVEKEIIHNISFNLYENEILGIVGESGSGKSVSSLAIMGLLPKKISKINSGSIIYDNKNLCALEPKDFQKLRGNDLAMIFQEPMSSLNPSMTCGKQVLEILLQHTHLSKSDAKNRVLELFDKVKLPDINRAYSAYPHQISGGQKQRVMIAMAIACNPKILIADEPTTALDVTVQKEIVMLLKELQKSEEMSIIFISHDLALVSEISDRIIVMYQGKIVEQGKTLEIFKNPKQTYTKGLIGSKPDLDIRLKKLPTISDFVNKTINRDIITKEERVERHEKLYSKPPLLEIINLEKEYMSSSGWFGKTEGFKAVNNVNFKVYEGETLGLVGESGCGKSTLSNAILMLDKPTAGKILFRGNDITKLNKSQLRDLRKDIQVIFQDPYSSLNPRIPIGKAIMEPMLVHQIGTSNEDRKQRVIELLEKVGLPQDSFYKYPHQFSGGQRQRIGIARTIALEPKLVICDESVSALDISVQAQVLNLLNSLKDNFGFTYIFISHDLSIVKYMSDNLIVMNQGKIEEMGEADLIYEQPEKEYTQKLIHAIPKGL